VKEPRQQIEELRAAIEHHDRHYYALADPEISDREYDDLLRWLRDLEHAHPEFDDPDSPTHRIGDTLTAGFHSVRHRVPMLSIANTYHPDELLEFDRRVHDGVGLVPDAPVPYFVEPKIDGVAIAVVFENGRLLQALTRGNGEEGDDITVNARTIRSLPLRLHDAPQGRLEFRGEVYLRRDELDRLNRERAQAGQPLYANARNLTAGTLKTLDPTVAAHRRLRLFIHSVVDGPALGLATHHEALEQCRRWGLPVVEEGAIHPHIASVRSALAAWEGRWADLPYEIDGLVIKVDSLPAWERLGSTRKDVRWAIAYKFKIEIGKTSVVGIDLQVGRTGRVTPVANLEALELGGTTVRRASLHNEEEIARLDLRLGDRVQVAKGGEIIPKILRVLPRPEEQRAAPFQMPNSCPACGGPLERYPDLVGSWCENPRCPAQIRRAVEHFASRQAMDIGGLGKALIEQLVAQQRVHDVADLYRLSADELARLPRMGVRSATNLIAQFEDSKHRPLERLLVGLGIRHVGRTAARTLARNFPNLDLLLEQPAEVLEALPEIGPVIAASVVRFAHDERSLRVVRALKEAGVGFDQLSGSPPPQRPSYRRRPSVGSPSLCHRLPPSPLPWPASAL
jgi:DNA ligase (NAD+)